jgi:hypothetical protein
MKSIEWSVDMGSHQKQITMPENIKSLITAEGMPLTEGASLVIRVENRQTGEEVIAQFFITEDSQLTIPENLQPFFDMAVDIRLTVFGSRKS